MEININKRSRKKTEVMGQGKKKKVFITLALFVILFFIIVSKNQKNTKTENLIENNNELKLETEKIYFNNFENEEKQIKQEEQQVNEKNNTNLDLKKENVMLATDSEIIFHKDNLIFVGDIAINKKNEMAYNKKGIDLIVDKTYKKYIEESDFFMGNMECVISDKGEPEIKQFTFRASPSMINLIKDLNVDLLNVANNHSIDYGKEAFLDMLDIFKKNDISYVGGGENDQEAYKEYIKEINGAKYAILSATVVVPYDSWFAKENSCGLSNGYNTGRIIKRIKELKQEVDKVIIYMHWGKEKEEVANETQRSIARAFVNAGADLIMGSHSHTIQDIEYYKSTPIIYGLGNFIFGGTWTDTVMLSVDFIYSNKNPKGRIQIKLFPGISGYELTKVYWKKEDINTMLYMIIMKSNNITIDENMYIVEKTEEETEKIQ